MKQVLLSLTLIAILVSCSEKAPIPKPPLYLRSELPDHKYKLYNESCPYKFEINTLFEVKDVANQRENTCHRDIDLGQLNGVINFSYIQMVEPLSAYVNYANDKVDEHKVKATGIEPRNFINKEKQVYGTIFKLEGDVATPFQFYLTDSVKNFASGVVYFNFRPNYDSILPTLNYLEQDINHLLNTFEWKK